MKDIFGNLKRKVKPSHMKKTRKSSLLIIPTLTTNQKSIEQSTASKLQSTPEDETGSLSNFSQLFDTLKDNLKRIDLLNEQLSLEAQVVIKKYDIHQKDQIKCRKLLAEREEINKKFLNQAQLLLTKLDDKETNLKAMAIDDDDPDDDDLFYDVDDSDSTSTSDIVVSTAVSPLTSADPTLPRTSIHPKSNNSSIKILMKVFSQSMGRDLSTIPVPATFFSEPISILQRITESLEYSSLLDKAALCQDPLEQMLYVSAFNISLYSTFVDRIFKPFNPLLNETYELNRENEYGWRSFSEQVTHHPPRLAQCTESLKGWTLSIETTPCFRFRGSYMVAELQGTFSLKFVKTDAFFVWSPVSTIANGFLTGKILMHVEGENEIVNKTNNDTCANKFHEEPSYFSKEQPHRCTSFVKDSQNMIKYVIEGTYVDKIEFSEVMTPTTFTSFSQIKKLDLSPKKLIWQRNNKLFDEDKHLYKSMYCFNSFTFTLNQFEANTAPTDTRLRPDIRLMEQGQWEQSDETKVVLEDKQRAKLRPLEKEPEPIWFRKEVDPLNANESRYVFTNDYWKCKKKQDWSKCPDLYI